jgi:hypothetical protein
MRCLNCHAVAMDTDRACVACGAPLSASGNRRNETHKPFFAMIFMIAGAVGYNAYYPPAQAVASAGGKINMDHVLMAGLVGGICAGLGGALDFLLNRRS